MRVGGSLEHTFRIENGLHFDCSDMATTVESVQRNNNLKEFILEVLSRNSDKVHESIREGPTFLGELEKGGDAIKRVYRCVRPNMQLSDEGQWNMSELIKEQVFIEKGNGVVVYLLCGSDKYPKMPRSVHKESGNVDSPSSDNSENVYEKTLNESSERNLHEYLRTCPVSFESTLE